MPIRVQNNLGGFCTGSYLYDLGECHGNGFANEEAFFKGLYNIRTSLRPYIITVTNSRQERVRKALDKIGFTTHSLSKTLSTSILTHSIYKSTLLSNLEKILDPNRLYKPVLSSKLIYSGCIVARKSISEKGLYRKIYRVNRTVITSGRKVAILDGRMSGLYCKDLIRVNSDPINLINNRWMVCKRSNRVKPSYAFVEIDRRDGTFKNTHFVISEKNFNNNNLDCELKVVRTLSNVGDYCPTATRHIKNMYGLNLSNREPRTLGVFLNSLKRERWI